MAAEDGCGPDGVRTGGGWLELNGDELCYDLTMWRLARQTNGFSKKVENHVHALSIYLIHYNVVRIHQTLRGTAAMPPRMIAHWY
jgi:hypothetical protein